MYKVNAPFMARHIVQYGFKVFHVEWSETQKCTFGFPIIQHEKLWNHIAQYGEPWTVHSPYTFYILGFLDTV